MLQESPENFEYLRARWKYTAQSRHEINLNSSSFRAQKSTSVCGTLTSTALFSHWTQMTRLVRSKCHPHTRHEDLSPLASVTYAERATVWISPEHTRRFFFYPSGVLVLPLTGHFIGWMADLGFDLFASSDHHFLKMPKWLSVWSLPPLFSNKFWGGCFTGFFVFLNYFPPRSFLNRFFLNSR